MSISAKLRNLYELADGPQRVLSMEGLRGFAVLLVFFVHFDALFAAYFPVHSATFAVLHFLGDVGNSGVDLFFVLSGYLIYGVVLRKTTTYWIFIKRRIERIYPTFLVVFSTYLILSVIFPSQTKIHGSVPRGLLYVFENVLLLPGMFHIQPIVTVAWSLSYEFAFYLVIPLSISFLGARTWKKSTRVAFLGVLSILYLAYALSAAESRVRLLMFVGGMLLYEMSTSDRLVQNLSNSTETIVCIGFVLSLMFIYLYDVRPEWFFVLPGRASGRDVLPGIAVFQGPYKTLALAITCPFVVLYSFKHYGLLNRVFSWTPLRYLGNMSYSYYLVHGLALHGIATAFLMAHISGPSVSLSYATLLVGFFATWIVSTLLFALVEKPISLRSVSRRNVVMSAQSSATNQMGIIRNPEGA